jgi:large subunit ribosomal protein L25
MAEAVTLDVQERKGNGTRQARRLRKSGQVPAVLYGHKEATVSVVLKAEDIARAIRHGARVVDLKLGGKLEKALIRDLQWDPLGHDIWHVDFARVSAEERITIEVRIELRGAAPGVAAGGVVVQSIHNLTVECPVISVPESIRVAVNELQLDGVIQVKQLQMPPGVIVKNDPDAIVVSCVPKAIEAEPAPAAAAAVPGAPEKAEPEVIGRKVEEGEAEAE